MSRAPMSIVLQMTLEEADQALEAFHRKWQDRFVISPTVADPGAAGQGTGPVASGSTFGGQHGGGSPSAWRGSDPAIGKTLREPTVMGQRLTSLPPAVMAAVAAADPQSAAYLQSLAAPSMTPADIRQAERFHQWNVRNQAYQQRQAVLSENRQERDQSYVDRRDFQEYKRDQADRVRGENRQQRDEGYVERSRNRDQADRVRGQNRQERNETYVARRDIAEARSAFRADLATMSPSQQHAALGAEMQGLDPSSVEYQQMRAQQARLAPRMGLNRVIAPNHLYMQAMFAAMDVAGTVTHISKASAQAAAAGSVEEALQHQVDAVTGGGGILSQILKGGWDIAGMVLPGLDSPAKLEESLYTESRRTKNLDRMQEIQVQSKINRLIQSAPEGTFRQRQLSLYAQETAAFVPLDKEISDLTGLMAMPYHTPEMATSQNQLMKRLLEAKTGVDDTRKYQETQLAFQRREYILGNLNTADQLGLLGGEGSTAVARKELSDRHNIEMTRARREQDPTILNAVSRRITAENQAFELTTGNQERANLIGASAAVTATLQRAGNNPYAAAMTEAIAQGRMGFLTADGNQARALAVGQMLATGISIATDFGRATRNTNLANWAEAGALSALIGGDPLSAAKIRLNANMNAELNNLPQGFFRFVTEAGIRGKYQKEDELVTKQITDQRILQKQGLEDQRDLATYDANGLDKSVRAEAILRQTNLGITHFAQQNRPDLERIVAETGLEQAKAYKRQLRIAQFTEGSAQEIAPGTFGPGGSSTVPRELEPEPISQALIKVESVMDKLVSFLSSLTGDD